MIIIFSCTCNNKTWLHLVGMDIDGKVHYDVILHDFGVEFTDISWFLLTDVNRYNLPWEFPLYAELALSK